MAYVDSDKEVEAKRQEIRKELTAKKEIFEHYKDYRKEDILNLIDSYALAKARLKVQGNYTQQHHEYVLKEWNKRAWFGLAEIQSKKLFDLQCRWRAEEVEVEGLSTSFEFEYPPVAILDMDVIPDISEQEIEDYIRFLHTPNGISRHYYYLSGHQNYDQIKLAHEEGGHMPEYYEYHYTIMGNTGLLSLPDIKGEEEQRLIDLALDFFKERHEKNKAKEEGKPKPPQKKFLTYYKDESQIELARFLNEKDVAGFIKDLSQWVKEKPQFEIRWAMEYLSFCYPEPVPMPAASDWQVAIEKAALEHITRKVAEILPGVYEEYLMKRQLGTPIGYIQGERKREDKPYPLLWMEIGEKLERGEEVDPKVTMSQKGNWN